MTLSSDPVRMGLVASLAWGALHAQDPSPPIAADNGRRESSAAAPNGVLELDGKDSYVELPSRAFTNLNEATIEGWVKWQSFGSMSRFFDLTLAGFSLDVMNRGTVSTLFCELFHDNKRTSLEVPDILALEKWTHIAASAGKDGLKLFVDGAPISTNSISGDWRSM